MKKTVFFLLMALIILSSVSFAASRSLKFTLMIETGGRTTMSNVAIKGSRMRIDSTVEGQKDITIVKSGKAYSYNPLSKVAVAMDMSGDEIFEGTRNYPVKYLAYIKGKGARYAGSSTIDGNAADIYSYNNEEGTQVKVWIWKKMDFPLKMAFTHGPDRETVIKFKNVVFNPAIPENTFEFIAGTKVVDVVGSQITDTALSEEAGNDQPAFPEGENPPDLPDQR